MEVFRITRADMILFKATVNEMKCRIFVISIKYISFALYCICFLTDFQKKGGSQFVAIFF